MLIRSINQIDLTPYITLITSKPHIRLPKFTYVDGNFLGEVGKVGAQSFTKRIELLK